MSNNTNEELSKKYEKDLKFLQKQLDSAISMYNTLKAEVASQSKVQSNFFSKISHEIRTPMNSLIGYSDLLIDNTTDEQSIYFGKYIKSSANRLLNIFTNFSDLANIDLGLTRLNPQEYQTESLIKPVIANARMDAVLKDIDLKVHINHNIPAKLSGDITHVRQVLTNLLQSAIDATSKGYVYLEISCDTNKDDACLSFTVKDTGLGMKNSEKAFLDEALNSRRPAFSLLGNNIDLRLITSKYYTQLMNGDISYTSRYGKGSTFTATLHQKALCTDTIGEAFINALEIDSSKKLSAPNVKVLIVDDSKVNLSVASNMLSQFDIAADITTNGYSAINMIDSVKYDLVFMDHMMPDIDGIETTERIRAKKGSYYKDLPIVALTANSTDDARNLFMEHNFSDYMSKPIEKEILTDMLYKWLPKTKILFKEYDMNKESFRDKFTIAFEKAGINIDKGLSYTGDNMDMYITVLKTLYKESENYMSNLKNALDTHNMHDYGICIHSIKGALASIGAAALSELALELELKAKAGDDAFIVANHNAFVIKFEKIINDINQIIISYDLDNSKREKKTKENLSHNEMNKNLIAVAENIKDYEIDEATKILNNLQTYNLDNSLEELISDILEKIDDFDYELAVSLIENRTGQK